MLNNFLTIACLGLSFMIKSYSYASMKDAFKNEMSCDLSNATHTTKTFGGDNAYYCLTKDGKIYRTSDSQYHAGYKGKIGTKDYKSAKYVGNLYFGPEIKEWSLENGDIYTYVCKGNYECEGKITRELFAKKIQQQSSSSNDAKTYFDRGMVKFNQNDKKGACDDFKKAMKFGHEGVTNWFQTDGASWCRNNKYN